MNILQTIFEYDNISLGFAAVSWEHAIREGCRLLEEKKLVAPQFYHDLIATTNQYGAYYIVAPKVAIPHVSDETLIVCNSVSLVSLKQEVPFPPKDEGVELLLTLALQKEFVETHDVIEQLITILQDRSLLYNMGICKNKEELKKVCAQYRVV